MQYQTNFETGFLKAKADYSAKQHYLMKADTVAKTAILAGAGEACIGVLLNEPVLGAPAKIMHSGVCIVQCGATVAAGDALMSDAAGKAIPHTGTNKSMGVALEAGASGATFLALITCANVLGASVNYGHWSFFFDMADIADGDLVSIFVPAFAGTITKIWWIQGDPVTTASKGSTINVEIGTTNLTGGVLTLTSAACTPLGKMIAATAVTANNVFNNTDTISVEASSTTTFIEGEGTLVIQYSC